MRKVHRNFTIDYDLATGMQSDIDTNWSNIINNLLRDFMGTKATEEEEQKVKQSINELEIKRNEISFEISRKRGILLQIQDKRKREEEEFIQKEKAELERKQAMVRSMKAAGE